MTRMEGKAVIPGSLPGRGELLEEIMCTVGGQMCGREWALKPKKGRSRIEDSRTPWLKPQHKEPESRVSILQRGWVGRAEAISQGLTDLPHNSNCNPCQNNQAIH